jgi:hypothetical protein
LSKLIRPKKEIADGTWKPLALEQVKQGHADGDITVAALCINIAVTPSRRRSSRATPREGPFKRPANSGLIALTTFEYHLAQVIGMSRRTCRPLG